MSKIKNKLSEKRADRIKREIVDSVSNNFSRLIVNTIDYNKTHDIIDFLKFGISLIMDRIWLVDDKESETYYAYEGIGSDIAEAINRSESNHILNTIKEHAGSIGAKDSDKLNEADLLKSIEFIKKNNFEPNIIITNIYDQFDFYTMKNFKQSKEVRGKFYIIGNYDSIPVFTYNLLPKGITLIYDKKKIGKFIIKEKISSNISEDFDREKAVKDVPELKKQNLDEKIQVQAFEIAKFHLENKNAGVVLKRDS